MADSPVSPLSSIASDELTEDLKTDELDSSLLLMPPSKRRRTGSPWDRESSINGHETEMDISSDSSGDIPGSPLNLSMAQDEEATGHDQVTVCRWDGCETGDLADMDSLVRHIHDEHIGSRQKRYSCEWEDCNRKGMPHASGYALRAHMRSHTREKPFYCALPECDRSFTRSDALAKHMRTVHETEALRPSDPVPKNHTNAPTKFQRLKLIMSAKHPDESGRDGEGSSRGTGGDGFTLGAAGHGSRPSTANAYEPYPSELHLSPEEAAMPPSRLFRLLRRQLHWSDQERMALQAEVKLLEERRRGEWMAKELLLENVMEAEMGAYRRRRQRGRKSPERKVVMLPHVLPLESMSGGVEEAWYRRDRDERGATGEEMQLGGG